MISIIRFNSIKCIRFRSIARKYAAVNLLKPEPLKKPNKVAFFVDLFGKCCRIK